ncbi:MAG: CoA-disulfide reductase [Mycoplasmatales bacterium]
MKKVLIVGGVAGGATAAARLRRLSEEYKIIMFEKDEYIAFANCGLPYYIGGVITDRDKLLVQTVEGMASRYNLDIRNFSEVISIDQVKNCVTVLNHQTGEQYVETFDKLILAPGANPIVPKFPSFDLQTNNYVFTLRNIPDTDKIYNYIQEKKVQTAIVIGGGFIGVEMAENLIERDIKVMLVDRAPHVLGQIDSEMVAEIELELKANGCELLLEKEIVDIKENQVIFADEQVLSADLIILAIGVVPNSKLAQTAGIKINERGGIKVNDQLETSRQDIYAIGDVIETNDFIFDQPTMVPLAGPANRQARIVADVIHGQVAKYRGVIGTSILKIFNLTAATVGINERVLKARQIDFDSIIVHRSSHAGYYPGSTNLSIKLLFNCKSGLVYGAQVVGVNGVEKRIDAIATAIKAKMTVFDLQDLELAYAPPYSSAKDPVNIAGYVASNVVDKVAKTFKVSEIEEIIKRKELVIDVRTKLEFELGAIDSAINIDLDSLRTNIDQLPVDKAKPIYLYCQVGQRGYLASCILKEMGYTNVYNLTGGYRTFSCVEKNACYEHDLNNVKESRCETIKVEITDLTKELDLTGLQCPGPIMETYKAINEIVDGGTLKVTVSDAGFKHDIGAWCQKQGHQLLQFEQLKNGTFVAVIQKKNEANGVGLDRLNTSKVAEDKGTIVMFSGDLDKALGAMIIAQGAQAMGKQMTVFFTFWGLNMLRKTENITVEKSLFEKTFGFMMPKGATKLSLSKMNFGGMGTQMIKSRMNEKNVDDLPTLMQTAQAAGVKFIACTMSMDLMGIKEEELIDGIEYAGVAKYIGESDNADLTLFI